MNQGELMNNDFQPYFNISPQFRDAFEKFKNNYLLDPDETLLGAVDCSENYFGRVFHRYFRCGILVFTNEDYWLVYRDDLNSNATTYCRKGLPFNILSDDPYQLRRWLDVADTYHHDLHVDLPNVIGRRYRDVYILDVKRYTVPKTIGHLIEIKMSVCRYPVKDELYMAFREIDEDFIASVLGASNHVHAGNFLDKPFIKEWPASPPELSDLMSDYHLDF